MKIDTNRLLSLAQSLVRIPSLSGQEEQVISCLKQEMHALGFDKVYTDEVGNLVGIIDGTQPGPTLLLDGHCDTVGIAPGNPWTHKPHAAVVDNERLYGRGASDMKGALAAMLHAAAGMDRTQFAGTIAVSATVMEEVMEGVALKTVIERIRPDYVVVGESTNLNLNHGGRGRAEIVVESHGKAAHSSNPHHGINAVSRILPALQALATMPRPSDPLLGEGILALTDIISDPYPGHSVIPTRCRVTYDRRLLSGESPESVLDEIRSLPSLTDEGIDVSIANGEHTTYTGVTLYSPKFFAAWKLQPDHILVRRAMDGLRRAGLEPELSAYRFCTNAAQSAGSMGIPTVGFGPSREERAHIVDEYIELEELFAAARGYQGIIESVLN